MYWTILIIYLDQFTDYEDYETSTYRQPMSPSTANNNKYINIRRNINGFHKATGICVNHGRFPYNEKSKLLQWYC